MFSKRKGIIAIVYKNSGLFLVVNTKNENISFIAGGVEEGENEKDAVIREIKEESGIEAEEHQIKKLPFINKFTYDKGYLKGINGEQQVYLVKVDEDAEIKPENIDVPWAKWMNKNEVVKNLTFENIKEIFENSLRYI